MKGGEVVDRSRAAEVVLALFGLLWLTHGLDFVLYEVFPRIVVRVFALALFTASAAVLFANRHRHGAELLRSWPVWIAPLLALLSILWSDAPDLTLRRSTSLLGSTCFGVFLALRFEVEERIRFVAVCVLILACLSVLLVLFFPDVGLMDIYGARLWRGVFGHKNYLARAMALGALAFLILAFRPSRSRWAAVGVAVCVAVGIASHSASGTILIGVTLVAAATLRIVQGLPGELRPSALAIVTLLALVGTGAAVVFADQVLGLVGRDSTLTGRIYIWQASLKEIGVQPWLGYGYGAVWYTDRPGGVSPIITHNVGFDPLTAHSGFFDLLLELGVVGLLALALPFTLCAIRGVAWITRHDSPIYLWPVAYLVFFAVSNVAESELLRQNSVFWVLFAATVVEATKAPRGQAPGESGT
jgi:O-antigen ligase